MKEEVKEAQIKLKQLRLAIVNLSDRLSECAEAEKDGTKYERLAEAYGQLTRILDRLTDSEYELEDIECLSKDL